MNWKKPRYLWISGIVIIPILIFILFKQQKNRPRPVENPPTLPPWDALTDAHRHSSALHIIDGNILSDLKPLPINSDLRIVFSKTLKPVAANINAVTIFCNGEKEPLPGQSMISNDTLTFKFERKFYTNLPVENPGTTWTGLKPDSSCEVRFDPSIESDDGVKIDADNLRPRFITETNDYGIYWFNESGEYLKAGETEQREFYDKEKPTVVFIHGLENTTSTNNFFRENPFAVRSKVIGEFNLFKTWKDQGYNIAIFYWPQFADESDVHNAEAKVWKADSNRTDDDGNLVKMRFRRRDGTFASSTETRSIAEIMLDDYLSALKNDQGKGVRLIAHSLGSQVASQFLNLLSEKIDKKQAPSKIFPQRLALLDPYFTNGDKDYLGNRWTGEVSRTYLKELNKKRDLAIEYIKSSMLSGAFIGDRNLELRAISLYVRIKPDFISIFDQAEAHTYAYVWYLLSLGRRLRADGGGFFGAAATPFEVRTQMNMSLEDAGSVWQIGGGDSANIADDRFEIRVNMCSE